MFRHYLLIIWPRLWSGKYCWIDKHAKIMFVCLLERTGKENRFSLYLSIYIYKLNASLNYLKDKKMKWTTIIALHFPFTSIYKHSIKSAYTGKKRKGIWMDIRVRQRQENVRKCVRIYYAFLFSHERICVRNGEYK